MRILVTNDDGINAPGLDVCAEIARALSDDVWVVAPEFDQSGVSHSLSLNDPLRMRAVDERRFAIKGTPTDCIIMGVRHILDGRAPDLILSGVNRGQNAAEDVTYSGTIAGALEAAILGIPSFALSQGYSAANRQNPHWDTAIAHGPGIIRRVLAEGIPRDVLVNVNFPDCAPADVQGIAVTSQGKRDQEWLRIDARQPVLLDRVCARAAAAVAQRNRPPGAAREPDLGDAVAHRHDRRAVHDPARRAI